LLQQSGACWAAETTQQGVIASVFAGEGEMSDTNNEGSADAYDVHRFGAGGTGVLRFAGAGPMPASQRDLGAFVLAGVAGELEWTRLTQCGVVCRGRPGGEEVVTPAALEQAAKVGLRVGVGYSFSLVEFRVGVLGVAPSADSVFPEPIWSPDVMVRLGRRSLGWFELGLGAYDASTVLRPGAYLGGGGGRVEELRISGHLGVHLVNGQCCQTLMPFGGIAQVDVERAVSRSLVAGVDLKLEAAGSLVFAGGLHLAVLL
jgi:hypothetical protein